MSDYNKMFQAMATILDNGEYILRRTAKILEDKPTQNIVRESDQDDLLFVDLIPRVTCDGICLTNENFAQFVDWLHININCESIETVYEYGHPQCVEFKLAGARIADVMNIGDWLVRINDNGKIRYAVYEDRQARDLFQLGGMND